MDKYYKIIDDHNLELKRKIAELDRYHKRKLLIIYILGTVAVGLVVLGYFIMRS